MVPSTFSQTRRCAEASNRLGAHLNVPLSYRIGLDVLCYVYYV